MADPNALALRILNVAREAVQDELDANVSVPGEAEPGEFYIELDGIDFAVKVEVL